MVTGSAELGRAAFVRRRWGEAFAHLAAAELSDPDDLERLAVAAHLVGRDDASDEAWDRAHAASVERGHADHAARCAFWLGMLLLLRGEQARGGGWLARAERLAGEAGDGCPTAGLLLVPAFLGALGRGDVEAASAVSADMTRLAQRVHDRELLVLGLLCTGEAAFQTGLVATARKAFDEAMVSVAAGEVSPLAAGIVYCAVIDACMRVGDLRRAGEWTDALHRWCGDQPEMVPYRGQCLVHRSQVLQARGAWPEAAFEAAHACRRLSEPRHPALGLALYQQGDLHRLRGEYAAAEAAYRAASSQGREPVPGFALLRLAQGEVDAAAATARRMVAEHRGKGLTTALLLAAAVEVLVASGYVDEARAVADEVADVAMGVDLPMVQAASAYASASVLLAAGDASGALNAFRNACHLWRDLDVPYEEARARAGVAKACAALGDLDTCALERDAARATFARLGARPDLERLDARAATALPGGLTERECAVLRQVAAGRTNRQIATELTISEHTVARHLQNIFLKLGLTSRSAATAYAYEHRIV